MEKSSLIDALSEMGFGPSPKSAYKIVKEQTASGGIALSWADRATFRDLLFERSIEAFDRIGKAEGAPVFFDRCFLDAIDYSGIIGVGLSEGMKQKAAFRRFDNPVFAFPPWQQIYAKDDERQHDFAAAVEDHQANVATYANTGYRLVEMPKICVAERADFVLCSISGVSA